MAALCCRSALVVFNTSANGRNLPKVIPGENFVWRNSNSFRRFGNDLLAGKRFVTTPVRGFRARREKPEAPQPKSEKKPAGKPSASQTGGGNANNTNKSSTSGGTSFWPFALKTGAYTAGFSAIIFGGCALWQRENIRKHHEEFWNRGLEKPKPHKRGEMRNNFNDIWNHLSLVHKVTYGIIGVNFLVWVGWKFANPRVMTKWFTLSRTGNHSATMFLSMFSHKSFIHFYINMYVLSSFCVAWRQLSHSVIGDSNINGHERYLAFYITAGMCSSLLSVVIKSIGRIPQPSLGASGAIMGLIGYICEKLPNNLLSIVFLPNWTFSADSAKNCIIAFDTIGLIIGALSAWRYMFFDHAGHLGGMLFGIWYARRGEKFIDKWSKYVMDIRNKK